MIFSQMAVINAATHVEWDLLRLSQLETYQMLNAAKNIQAGRQSRLKFD